jgi:hypothetical protein
VSRQSLLERLPKNYVANRAAASSLNFGERVKQVAYTVNMVLQISEHFNRKFKLPAITYLSCLGGYLYILTLYMASIRSD